MEQWAHWSSVSFLFPPPFTFNFVSQSVKAWILLLLLSILSYSLPILLQIANLAESTEDLGARERETAGNKGGQEGTLRAVTVPNSSKTVC